MSRWWAPACGFAADRNGGRVRRRAVADPAPSLGQRLALLDRADDHTASSTGPVRYGRNQDGSDAMSMIKAMPPRVPGSRRSVPRNLTEEQRERLRTLLEDPDTWVLRPGWLRFLVDGDEGQIVATDKLNADERAAALAWLKQQRHALYQVLEGGERAPDGWLEDLPLYQRLAS